MRRLTRMAVKNLRNVICLIFLLAAILFLLGPKGGSVKSENEGKMSSREILTAVAPSGTAPSLTPDSMKAVLQTPFKLFGIVLDQDGKAVVGAQVEAAVLNNFTEGGTPITAKSDAAGRFSIQYHGASLHVHVSKPGYYHVDPDGSLNPSSQGFDFGADQGRGLHRSDPASPDIFHLRKAGNPEDLERLDAVSKVPRDGSPVTVGLSNTSKVTLRIRCHTTEDGKTPIDPYNWRCEVDVVGGGIQESTVETNFLAPENGYASSAVIDMSKTLGNNKWDNDVTRSYWLRFPDNTVGRIKFRMIAGGDHFAEIGGYRNPTANIRNLEPKPSER